MAPLKVEETLHDYLRRHFEKISKGNARQFAEQNAVTKVDVVLHKSKPGTGA
jgi:hypothetical protein